MKLAVFGATGNVGSALVPAALTAGHTLHVLCRDPSKLPAQPQAVMLINGNALDPDMVAKTVIGCDAVLSTLGGLRDTDSIRIGTHHILTAMRHQGIRRLVVMQGFHLHMPHDPNNLGKKLVRPLMRAASLTLLADSQAMADQLLATTDIDWTLVRAPRVRVAPATGRVRTGDLKLGPWSSVTNSDVAAMMLHCLDDPATTGTAPMIASR
ncbi:MAG: NAD(P)H-binding protein [Mycobacteriaceae bacterium]